MSDFAMTDISALMSANNATEAKNSINRKGSNELNMEDFLQLMIVQLQSQTIDDTMDTSEMMNQMVQMQMITAITNLTESSVMSYAASLVGQVVTIGIVENNTLEEREILVMGTGTMNSQQVIFGSDGNYYGLNQIMAVGRLPNEDGSYGVSGSGGTSNKNPSTEGAGNATDKDPGTGSTGDVTDKEPGTGEGGEAGSVTDPGGTAEGSGATENPEYQGEQGAPTDE
ncbi:MAG: hypothetical protein K2K53_12840 [Oscillospiraceae bacterium]|nr:hypothetical protein [Oscillospiraceae bacterium]